jgi:hypothetical protein
VKARCLRVAMLSLGLVATGAVVSSTLLGACMTDGCWTGCYLSTKWCNGSEEPLGFDFGSNSVYMANSCAINASGYPGNLAPRSYDVMASCNSECPSDSPAPGYISTQERETFSQGNFNTACAPPPGG